MERYARTGSPWRDPPTAFGSCDTVFKRYRDWVRAAIFKRLFDAVSNERDMAYALVDATIVKVHRHAQGAKGGTASQATGRSKGGMTTKSWPLPMSWAISSASCCCPDSALTRSGSRP